MDSESVTHDALPDGLVVADAYGNVVLTNDVAREQLGLDGDGGIGRPLRDVLLLRDRDGTEWWTMHRPYDGPGQPGLVHRAVRGSCREATRCSSPDGSCVPGAAAP